MVESGAALPMRRKIDLDETAERLCGLGEMR
jgi:hypothetical protein